MPVNTINILRIALLVLISLFILILIVYSIIKICTKRKLFLNKSTILFIETIIIFIVILISLISLFDFSPVDIYKGSNSLIKVTQQLDEDSIYFAKFEQQIDEHNQKTDVLLFNIDTEEQHILFLIQKKGCYESSESFHKSILKKEYDGKIGKIIFDPVKKEHIYNIFISNYYGKIIVPISYDLEMQISYSCTSSINDCFQLIEDTIKNLQ